MFTLDIPNWLVYKVLIKSSFSYFSANTSFQWVAHNAK